MKSGCGGMIWNVKRRTGMHTHAQITFTDLLDSAAAAATFALCSYRNFIRSHVYRLHLPEHVQISVRRSFYSLHIHYNDMLIQGAQNKNKESKKSMNLYSTRINSVVDREKDQFSVYFHNAYTAYSEWSLIPSSFFYQKT